MDVKIEEVDQENKRLSLALVTEITDEETTDIEKADVKQYIQNQAKYEKSDSMGTLGEILKEKLKEKEKK